MRKQGTSMKLYYLNFKMVWIFVYVCTAIVLMSNALNIKDSDLSVLGIAVTAAFAELGIHTGFIVWKAKVENCRKYKDVNRMNRLLEEEE